MSPTRHLRDTAAAHLAAGRLDEAAAAYRQLLARLPRDFEALHRLGMLKVQAGDSKEGHGLLQAALAVDPGQAEAWLHHGMAAQNLGQAEQAAASYRRALAINSDYPAALFRLGLLLRGLRRHEEALACLERCAVLAPGETMVFQQRGEMKFECDDLEGALADFDAVLRLQPGLAQAQLYRGVALARLERHGEALAAMDLAAAQAPGRAEIHFNRGVLLESLGRGDEAMAAYDRTLKLNPGHADAWNNRGNLLRNQGRLEDAVDSLRRAIALVPGHVAARTNRGTALWMLNRNAEALADFRRLMEIAPADRNAPGGMLSAALALCDWDTVEALRPRLETEAADGRAIVSPLQMALLTDNSRLLHDSAAHFITKLVPMAAQPRPALRPADGTIRIAYLSADFQAHATAYLIADLIERHDRGRFDVIGVSFGQDNGGTLRARLAGAFDRFLDVRQLSDAEVAARLRQMDVDIAIDLKGHTQWGRPGIFAARAAPLQVAYLGYPGPMGAAFYDYVIADPVTLPHDEQPFYDEKIVHLPDCYQCNDPARPFIALTRAAAGLPPDGFVFASFNQHRKITRPLFDIWMRLLAAVPGSLLWLLDDSANAQLRAHAAARGVDPARLIFAPRLELESHLARAAAADLMLDTLPYNAHTTASDALWMAVPLVTCRGKAFAGRVAASLLAAIAVPELITESLEDYEALALALARDPARLAGVKEKLVVNRTTTPLFDAARFCRHIERGYEMMMEIARAGDAPRPFDVPAIED